ncbi:DHHW family protein [Fusibacter ferrireducens]|uniref:DHHW protein n=1 Tax=Fusibacter ferrireducens TaxID=2785058 RepID=A0ABR9ZNE7_9FIRM|nr:DHHW family protein [Fusibacter ferrireducens]MBF4691993.1 hypothetical protein [Fusibacter ferrireducens]
MKRFYFPALFFLIFILVFNIMSFSNNGALMLNAINSRSSLWDSIADRSLFDDIETIYSDDFPWRTSFLSLSAQMDSLKGFSNKMSIIDTEGINVASDWKQQTNTHNDSVSENASKQMPESDGVEEDLVNTVEMGSVLIMDNTAYELNIYNPDAISLYAQTLNAFKSKLPETVAVDAMLVPTQIEFLDDPEVKALTYSQSETINEAYKQLVNVNPIDVLETLNDHANEYIYFRTDHHWTQLGAFYAYEIYKKALKSESDTELALEPYQTDVHYELSNYLGSLYRVTQSEVLRSTPDIVNVNVPKSAQSAVFYFGSDLIGEPNPVVSELYSTPEDEYAVFLKGDHALIQIVSKDACSNDKLLVIKDSYANAFIPYLTADFKDIYVIDPRLWEGNLIDFVREQKVDRVLFLNYALINRFNGYNELLGEIFN